MTWPVGVSLGTSRLDEGTDRPPREVFLLLVQTVQRLVDYGEPVVSGGLIGVQTFSSSGTYVPADGVGSVIVELIGGGGGGGGAWPAAGNTAVGGGGGAGMYLTCRLTRAQLNAMPTPLAIPVTIGTGGPGGVGASSGGYGGETRFGEGTGTTCVAEGGMGGRATVAAGANGVVSGGSGAQSHTGYGQVLSAISGSSGDVGLWINTTLMVAGRGADSPFGKGGPGAFANNVSYGGGGQFGLGPGAGGGGAACSNGGNADGGQGAPGFVRIWEYH